MWKNRLLYLLFLAGMFVFYINYSGWISRYILYFTLLLPLFSLLCSLPSLLKSSVSLELCEECVMGDEVFAQVRLSSLMKAGPVLCMFSVSIEELGTGQQRRERVVVSRTRLTPLRADTEHCGVYVWRLGGCRVLDLMGLFSFPLTHPDDRRLTVYPKPEKPSPAPSFSAFANTAYRPMRGGGFSERHEMREYRPGDPMRSVHWKLSAKTEDLIVREPQEAVRRRVIVTFDLYRDRDMADRVFGALLWVCNELLAREVGHEACCIDPNTSAPVTAEIRTGEALHAFLRDVMSIPVEQSAPSLRGRSFPGADWVYHVDPREEAAHEG